MILPISLTAAGAAALVNLWLAMRIGQVRMARKIDKGDGGDPALISRMPAQANFVENTPFVLLLIALIEFARGTSPLLWGVAAVYLLARIAHGLGMDRASPSPLRMGGIMVTFVVLIGLAGWAIAIPWLAPAGTAVTVPAG